MVLGWRGAFCTSISKDQQEGEFSTIKDHKPDPIQSPRFGSRFSAFFSNPSTPNLRCKTAATPHHEPPHTAAFTTNSAPQSPRLKCKTRNSTRFFTRSNPSSPRETSTFSVIKSSLRSSKSRCVICLHSVKTGEGTAIFTSECGHSFHFPCIASKTKEQKLLTCPICKSNWNEIHLLDNRKSEPIAKNSNNSTNNEKRINLKVYNDDEPLSSPICGARFNPILESDETEEENEEFPGFSVTHNFLKTRNVEIALSPESAVVSVGRASESHAVVLKVKAPAAAGRRAPVDLVAVVDVGGSLTGEKLRVVKRMMRVMVSSLSGDDRLSIVAFSAVSKRLLNLRRMNSGGRRAARRIIDAIVAIEGSAACAADSLKKAAKVIDDRREKNPSSSILLFSDAPHNDPVILSTHQQIPVHSFSLTAPSNDTFTKCINDLLTVVIQDMKIQLRPEPNSDPIEISAVYSTIGSRPAWVGSGSSWLGLGDFHSEEEREFLLELKVPSSSFTGTHHRVLSVRCCYRGSLTGQPVYEKERLIRVPHPNASRLKYRFITVRAVAESMRLVERNDLAGAHYMLASARALVLKSGEEFVSQLEAELSQLNWKKRAGHEREAFQLEEKVEALTPMSAWRAAERLAKLATVRKSLNRVSDLHGFENARF